MGFEQGPDEDPVQRAFGHPLGTNPEDPKILGELPEYGMKALDWMNRGISLAAPFEKPLIHAAEGLGSTAGHVAETSSKMLPGLGIGISLAGAGYEAYKGGQVIAEDGKDAIHDQRLYNAGAGVASNGVHALLGGLSFAGPVAPFAVAADALLTAGEVGTDLAGGASRMLFGEKAGFSANSVEGGLLRATAGDQSSGYDAGNWVTNKLGPGTMSSLAGAATMTAVNMFDTPMNLLKGAYRGITGEVQAAQDGVNNGEGLMGWDKTHGLNPLALPENNPLLMKMGLGGGNAGGQPAAHATAGLGGGVGHVAAGLGGAVGHVRGGVGGAVGHLGGGVGGAVSAGLGKLGGW